MYQIREPAVNRFRRLQFAAQIATYVQLTAVPDLDGNRQGGARPLLPPLERGTENFFVFRKIIHILLIQS